MPVPRKPLCQSYPSSLRKRMGPQARGVVSCLLGAGVVESGWTTSGCLYIQLWRRGHDSRNHGRRRTREQSLRRDLIGALRGVTRDEAGEANANPKHGKRHIATMKTRRTQVIGSLAGAGPKMCSWAWLLVFLLEGLGAFQLTTPVM